MNKTSYAAACLAAFFLLSGLPVMPLSAQEECVPDIRLKVKVYLEGALTGAAAPPGPPPSPSGLKPGDEFQDCDECPEMIVVPAGSFCMGSPMGESGQDSDELPVHKVTISRPFAVGVFEVTFNEWYACVDQRGCTRMPSTDTEVGGRGPVFNVNWNDAKEYVAWLSKKTEKQYRLLTEAEWEYAARARTTTPWHFGSTITTSQANYSASGFSRTTPVGTYKPNAFGLHDVHGNLWEWVEDCYHDSYNGAPRDGSAWTEDCFSPEQPVLRGGSWVSRPQSLRSANRNRSITINRNNDIGFRVGRTLSP